jgi:hypothetical protein
VTFAEAALRWCALSARALGWRPAEFWQATPADLVNALRDPAQTATGAVAPSRELITQMMERDAHGRQS